jgi:uncharacterized protein DUF6896
MGEDKRISVAKQELRQAIVYYIERQQLVVQAMLDLKLDINLIGKFGALAWSYDESSSENSLSQIDSLLQHTFDEHQREILYARKYAIEGKVSRKGVWKDRTGQEWSYQLHGGGCLLQNMLTQEPLDWDCPNPKAFDIFFFSRHLGWRLITSQMDDSLIYLRKLQIEHDSIYSLTDILLEKLIKDGIVEGTQMPMGLVYLLHDVS